MEDKHFEVKNVIKLKSNEFVWSVNLQRSIIYEGEVFVRVTNTTCFGGYFYGMVIDKYGHIHGEIGFSPEEVDYSVKWESIDAFINENEKKRFELFNPKTVSFDDCFNKK